MSNDANEVQEELDKFCTEVALRLKPYLTYDAASKWVASPVKLRDYLRRSYIDIKQSPSGYGISICYVVMTNLVEVVFNVMDELGVTMFHPSIPMQNRVPTFLIRADGDDLKNSLPTIRIQMSVLRTYDSKGVSNYKLVMCSHSGQRMSEHVFKPLIDPMFEDKNFEKFKEMLDDFKSL